MIVKPFRGLRPRPDLAQRIPSPPYDVLDSEEARACAGEDPYSFLHVIKPEIDLAPETGAHDERVYAKGRENLLGMIDRGWLVRDEAPGYYVYRQRMEDHEQTGILGAAAVQDYHEDRIKKHEHTRPEKEEDRIRLNDTLGVHPGPVFLTYPALPELNAVVNGIVDSEPAVRFTAVDGIEHLLWVVDDPAGTTRIERLFGQIRQTYVADGHHRAAAAAKVGALRRSRIENPTGEEPFHYFMAVHFPAEQVKVLDYNRVVRDLNGLDLEALLARIDSAGFQVAADHKLRKPPHRQTFGMYLEGRWFLLTARSEICGGDDPVQRLDVSILTRNLLEPLLGIGDQRTDKRIDFVGGIRGMDELERRVDSGRDAVGFSLFPTTLDELMAVADAGLVMPPKSTWFEPKLRSGMVVQPLDGETL